MHAAVYDRFGEPEDVRWSEIPEPKVGPETVVVQVRAASVNPVDWQTLGGALAARFDTLFPVVPGWDVAGVVSAIGPGVRELRVGDEVMGYIRQDVVHSGSFAERVGVPERLLVRKPRELGWEQAACLPLTGTTAWQGLVEGLGVRSGETVYVQGASGGVGSLVVQFALAAGARVIGACSPDNAEWLRDLGAVPVDYHRDVAAQVRAAVGTVDAVYDVFGGSALRTEVDLLSADDRSRLLSLVDDGVRDLGGRYLFARPDRDDLARLVAATVREGITSRVATVLPMREAARALAVSKREHPRGKVVLVAED